MLNNIAPICFTYGLEESLKNKTSRKLTINVIFNDLDAVNKTIKSGPKEKPFFQTEKTAYEYWDKRFKRLYFIDDEVRKKIEFNICVSKRTSILYNLDSKINIVKNILHNLDTKTIIFSNSLDAVFKVTPNVISSRTSNTHNENIKRNFNLDKINVIGSFKKLKQGVNLVGLDNCIIMSYYSKDLDFIQRIGRLRDNGEIGNIFIIVTKNTQEEIWFTKIIENYKNLNIKYFNNSDEWLKNKKK
tara:strand:- start:4965 stop:5696 length:732 start_codon:yes stop_codon:yes gene_type:complete